MDIEKIKNQISESSKEAESVRQQFEVNAKNINEIQGHQSALRDRFIALKSVIGFCEKIISEDELTE